MCKIWPRSKHVQGVKWPIELPVVKYLYFGRAKKGDGLKKANFKKTLVVGVYSVGMHFRKANCTYSFRAFMVDIDSNKGK